MRIKQHWLLYSLYVDLKSHRIIQSQKGQKSVEKDFVDEKLVFIRFSLA